MSEKLCVRVCGMRFNAQPASAPLVRLWSPQVVLRTPDGDDGIRIAGYAYPSAMDDNDYKPPEVLQTFVEASANKPVLVSGFGCMITLRPECLLSAISEASIQVGAPTVVSGPRSAYTLLH